MKTCLMGCVLASACQLCAMTSADAVSILLNSRNATSKRNFEMAQEMVAKDAENGKPLQQFVFAVTTDDAELAKRYLNASRGKIQELAETKGNSLACYLLSMEKNDFGMLEKAVEGGNVQAFNALGTILIQEALSHPGGATNDLARLKRGFELFGAAAAKRDPNGFVNLGTCYLHGYGCEPDPAMAFSSFSAAAEAGHPEGMDYLSSCYKYGRGIRKNDELCLLWSMRARSARGDESAEKWLRDRK